MSAKSLRQRELRELVIAANSGEASDDQIARLDELIRGDRQLANYAAQLLDQQASLAWMGSMRSDPADSSACAVLAAEIAKECQEVRVERESTSKHYFWIWPTIAVGIGFVLGGLTAAMIYRAVVADVASPQIAAAVGSQPAQPMYEAHLIRSTACLWDGSSLGSPEIGSGLKSGESLHLLEGLAEFTLRWAGSGRATLSLEGPAGMMLTTEGMPTLRFGRLSATINTSFRPFVLETSIGNLSLAEFGSIGVSSFGNEGEIHIFNGVATFEPAWRSPDQTLPLRIEAGQSIRIQTGDDGEPKISWHAAEPDYFATQMSMSSDGLAIPQSYVNAVKESQPIGYWRFDRGEWPNVSNAMGPQFACQVTAALGRTVYQNNEAIEFGVTKEGGEILSTDSIDESIRDSYTVEFWVKPSHYHLGSVVSLVGDKPAKSGILPHGMLIELGGTGKIPTAIHHPGCIRFLHRSPARDFAGTSCYSKTAYTLRKWQHVVATKDGPTMQLYVDGELVAEGRDPSPLPSGLRLLVGRLYPSSADRPFIGQLDELALYNRALRTEEISAHYHLVRPVKASEPSI